MQVGPKVLFFLVFTLLVVQGWPVKTYHDFRYEPQTFLVDWKGRAPPTKYRSRVGVVSGICLIDVIDAWSSRCVCVIFVTLFVFYVHVVRVVGERCALSI